MNSGHLVIHLEPTPTPEQAAAAVAAAAAVSEAASEEAAMSFLAASPKAMQVTATATAAATASASASAAEAKHAPRPPVNGYESERAVVMIAMLERFNAPLVRLLEQLHRNTVGGTHSGPIDPLVDTFRAHVNAVMAAPALASLPLISASPLCPTPPARSAASAGAGAGAGAGVAFNSRHRPVSKTYKDRKGL
jgi:hypothetical protein